jgi:hypothetical protein
MAGWNRVDKDKHEYHPVRAVFSNPAESGWLVSTRVANLLKGALDELLALLADVVIDGGHCLDRAGGRSGEGEFAVRHFALVQCERAVAQNDEATVGEMAGFVFVEIKDYFLVGKCILGNFHG